MNFKKTAGAAILLAALALPAPAYEVFIWRPSAAKEAISTTGRLTSHGELFGYWLGPSTVPSYNDFSGAVDRWNFGFQDLVQITPTTRLKAQLLTHDDGRQRTKFDWHFDLRQEVFENLVLILGHDSDHDAEHLSRRAGKPYYANRNYIGLGLPIEGRDFHLEAFTWFFHHTNLRAHLDLSGEKVKQEIGLRAAGRLAEGFTVHGQLFAQTDTLFYLGRAWNFEILGRLALTPWLELSCGFSLWRDLEVSPGGLKQSFSKVMWGIAVPF